MANCGLVNSTDVSNCGLVKEPIYCIYVSVSMWAQLLQDSQFAFLHCSVAWCSSFHISSSFSRKSFDARIGRMSCAQDKFVGQHVMHFKTGRAGLVAYLRRYGSDPLGGKVLIQFDDGKDELRWGRVRSDRLGPRWQQKLGLVSNVVVVPSCQC